MIKTITNNTALKYGISAGISFFLDLALFTIFSLMIKGIFIDNTIIVATVMARILSSLINYYMNRNLVFTSNNKKFDKDTLIKYYMLVIIQMLISAYLVTNIYKLVSFNPTLIKIPVDIFIFVINYFIQKKFIFTK